MKISVFSVLDDIIKHFCFILTFYNMHYIHKTDLNKIIILLFIPVVMSWRKKYINNSEEKLRPF